MIRLGSTFRWAIVCIMAASVLNAAAGSEFERCCSYARAIADVNKEWDAHQQTAQNLKDRYQACMVKIDGTQAEFARLSQVRQLHQFFLVEAAVRRNNALSRMNDAANQANSTPEAPRPVSTAEQRQVDEQLIAATLTTDYLQHQLRELDATSRVVVERRFHAINDLLKIGQDYEGWLREENSLIDQYWQVADLLGERSELELQAAQRELSNGDNSCPGVRLARASVLTQLDQIDEALAELDAIPQFEEWSQVVAAFRARVHMHAGNREQAMKALRQVNPRGRLNPRVRLLRAQVLSMDADLDDAKTEWELLLKSQQEEIAARQSLALVLLASTKVSAKEKQEALSHAKAAVGLAGGQKWSCHLALALAYAANGEKDKSLAACQEAESLAIGSQKSLCQKTAEQIEAGQRVVWKFK